MDMICRNLTKKYGSGSDEKGFALQKLDLNIKEGVTALIGPNGAGKSTLLKILAAIIHPTDGEALFCNESINPDNTGYKKILGYLPQFFGVYENISGVEFLKYMAAIKGIERAAAYSKINELVSLFNLSDAIDNKLKTYSGGMKQRIGIISALLNDPSVIILDEPFSGLDPEERNTMIRLIQHLGLDRIIIFSSHILSDAESIANNFAILNRGKLLLHSVCGNFERHLQWRVYEGEVDFKRYDSIIKEKVIIGNVKYQGEKIIIRIICENPPHGDFKHVEAKLEDLYLYLIKKDGESL